MAVKKDNDKVIEQLLNDEVALLDGDPSLAVFSFDENDRMGIENKELEIIYESNGMLFPRKRFLAFTISELCVRIFNQETMPNNPKINIVVGCRAVEGNNDRIRNILF